ncbi:MAG TPA: ribose 5-phosphate isomerase B [Firmicutes bacterium]|jgi:ribose 5-phosphate isomerase B|nr:MAG: ribose 5-phosphate isomerase [Peptococcaceae bacterium 1109]HHT74269.1 ribose 5-phosphate isomerase B [Bacillota bacterium]
MKIAIGSDHGGFHAKAEIIRFLQAEQYEVEDFGTHSAESCDYPDIAHKVGEAVVGGECDLGILICGTGIGVSIAANKVPGVRAALCSDTYSARMARAHNNSNVLCMGARVLGTGLMEDIVKAYLTGEFEGGRHARRVDKIEYR